jgi:hypothetical protein
MTEKPGHFEKGVWIEDQPPAPTRDQDAIDRRLAEATRGVISSIDTVMTVTRDLVTTEEGRQYIEKSFTDTRSQIQQSLDAFIRQARADLDKTKADLEKARTDRQAKTAGNPAEKS